MRIHCTQLRIRAQGVSSPSVVSEQTSQSMFFPTIEEASCAHPWDGSLKGLPRHKGAGAAHLMLPGRVGWWGRGRHGELVLQDGRQLLQHERQLHDARAALLQQQRHLCYRARDVGDGGGVDEGCLVQEEGEREGSEEWRCSWRLVQGSGWPGVILPFPTFSAAARHAGQQSWGGEIWLVQEGGTCQMQLNPHYVYKAHPQCS